MKKTLYALSSVLLLSVSVFAQNTELINGKLRATIGPQGETTPNGNYSFLEILDGDDWISLMFESGLIIGGQDPNGELVLFTTTDGPLEAGIRDLGVEIGAPWRVTGEQIAAHLADYNDNGVVDDRISEIFAWPGTSSVFSEEYNGFPLYGPDGIYHMAGYWDQNLNANYNPDIGEYPILWVRGCLDREPRSIPAEIVFIPVLLRDADGELLFDVRFTAFRFGCEENESVISNTIFVQYQITNVSDMQFDNTFVGYWADGDLGCFADDYMGVFPDRNTAYFLSLIHI